MNWDYVAGFFDGEGCVYKAPRTRCTTLSIGNTNRRVLEEIKAFLGCGQIYLTRQGNHKHRTFFTFCTSARHDVVRIAQELESRCVVKPTRLRDAINFIEQQTWRRPFGNVAILTKALLTQEYLVSQLTMREIATRHAVSITAVRNHLLLNGLRPRTKREARLLTLTS